MEIIQVALYKFVTCKGFDTRFFYCYKTEKYLWSTKVLKMLGSQFDGKLASVLLIILANQICLMNFTGGRV